MAEIRDDAGPLGCLTRRERVIAIQFAEGLTYRAIGTALFIAPTTVRTHLEAIYRKLGIRNKTALTMLIAAHRGRETVPPQAALAVSDEVDADKHPRTDSGPPIIAVLPFDNLARDERWDRLADGLTQDVITDLARHPDVQVVARHTMLSYKGRLADVRAIGRELGARYMLEGSIQAAAGRVRVTAQLIDGFTGAHLWAERYERAQAELFTIQDEVTEKVSNAIGAWSGLLARVGRVAARRKPPGSLEAYDLYLLGIEQKHRQTRESCAEAVRLFARAVELDPGFARAWTSLGLAYATIAANGFTGDPQGATGRWRECIEKALALDPSDAMARLAMGDLRAMDGDLIGAAEQYQWALATAPGDADRLAWLAGGFSLVVGDLEQAAELGRRALRLNPSAPVWYYSMLGRAEYVRGRYRESIAALQRASPNAAATLLFLAMAQAQLGETEEVRKLVARLRTEFPAFTAASFIRDYPVTNPPALTAVRQGAAMAGLL